MTKGLMERSLHHETALGRVREKAKLAKEELFALRNWKLVTEQKLKLAKQAKDEFQKLMEELKKTLKNKEKEVRQAKEVSVLEYRDSDTLIAKLGVSYNDRFMMPSVKQRPCIQSFIFPLSTLVFLSQHLFTLSSQTTQMSCLERRSSSSMPL